MGDTKVSHRNQAKLSCVGISSWSPLLVYQRDGLSGAGARELAEKDEDMPAVQSVPSHVAAIKMKNVDIHYLFLRVWRVTNEEISTSPFLSC